jgi:hypothetical protein
MLNDRDRRPVPTGLELVHESTGSGPGRYRYSMTRSYRRGEDSFRVTIERDSYEHQSHAIVEVLTTARTWSHVADNPPSNWYESTSLWGEKGTGVNPEPGFTTLRRLADALAADAALIVPPSAAATSPKASE